jgi:hypothetical protein
MPEKNWRTLFPELPHEPQDLDLIRRHLKWTPAQRLRNLEQVHAFVKRARAAPFRPGVSGPNATRRKRRIARRTSPLYRCSGPCSLKSVVGSAPKPRHRDPATPVVALVVAAPIDGAKPGPKAELPRLNARRPELSERQAQRPCRSPRRRCDGEAHRACVRGVAEDEIGRDCGEHSDGQRRSHKESEVRHEP